MKEGDRMPPVPHFNPGQSAADIGGVTRGVLSRKGGVLKVDRNAFLDLLQCSLRALEVLDRPNAHGAYAFTAGELCEALDPFQDYFDAARGEDSEAITAPRDDDPWPPDLDAFAQSGSPYAADPLPDSLLREISRSAHAAAMGVLLGILLGAAGAAALLNHQPPDATQTEITHANDH